MAQKDIWKYQKIQNTNIKKRFSPTNIKKNTKYKFQKNTNIKKYKY